MMKKSFTVREKVLLAILGVLVIGALYYYVFYIPTIEEMEKYKQDNVAIEDQILAVQIQAGKINLMEKELEAIKNGDTVVSPLPMYDNSRKIMNELNDILALTMEYEVEFGKIEEDEDSNIVRRNVRIFFKTNSYNVVKSVLSQVNYGEYRCVIKDLGVTQNAGLYHIDVSITYFEYQE